jgi:poly(A) polymerase
MILYFKRFIDKICLKFRRDDNVDCTVIARAKHGLSRKKISENALKVLYRLKKAGYDSYLVGGGVRDVLLHKPTKDFDIATNAEPSQVRKLFSNSRIIGRRFRLVHVLFRNEVIEVSTFRANKLLASDDLNTEESGDNVFGTLEEDAWRRDFTINALYYTIEDFSIVDYTGGYNDLKRRQLRVIGDPLERAREDPVRLLRALRFMAKLNFKVDSSLDSVLRLQGDLINQVPGARLLHEFEKLFCSGYALPVFMKLKEYGYLQYFFSAEAVGLLNSVDSNAYDLVTAALQSADSRYKAGNNLNMGFVLAVFLWPAVESRVKSADLFSRRFYQALHMSIGSVVRDQLSTLVVPKRLVSMMKSMWLLQYNFERRRPKRVTSLLRHRYFRAAFDLLKLRSDVEPELKQVFKWWEKIHLSSDKQREKIIVNWTQNYTVYQDDTKKS